eukprot:TRINITY_DN4951_c0_g1_i2.p1 TRINITY_DN4951_c0_g1~~TRINITY_DN4951_c0_g1_i2.p1  ORF type:complete len:347 (-),score=29.14 TRINITY_DN4951_c0_g1_i2:8-1048(-)
MSIPPPEVLFNVDEFEDDDDIEFSQYNIKRLIVSSLLFSWFSDITLYPIILVNTRLKIQGQPGVPQTWGSYSNTFSGIRRVIAKEGFRGLYRGFFTCASINPGAQFLYYSTYETCKMGFESYYPKMKERWPGLPAQSHAEHLAFLSFGGFSEVVAALLFVPLNVLTSRLQIQGADASKSLYPYKHGRDAVRCIWRTEGIRGYYRGLGSSLVMDMPCSAISWLTYENLKRRFVKYFNDHQIVYHSVETTRQLIITMSGTLAGGFAAAVTNPIAMATVRVQVQDQSQRIYKHGFHAMWKMLKSEGPLCLFRGTGARMLGMAPATGFGFTFFELVKSYSKLRPDEINPK